MLMFSLCLVLGWICFVMATVNVVRLAYDYVLKDDDSYGWYAALRMTVFGATLAAWYFLVFYLAPAYLVFGHSI